MGSILSLLLALVLVALQTAPPPDVQGFPAVQAPEDLARVRLPDTIDGAADLFKRLPTQVAGHTKDPQFDRVSAQRTTAGYGKDARITGMPTALLYLQAVNLAADSFFPTNWTGGHVIAYMAGQRKGAGDAGRDGALFWMRNETSPSAPGSADPIVVHGILFGRIDSSWMFSVQADTPDHRDALLRAFVAAARQLTQ